MSSERYESAFLRNLRRALVEDARAEIAFVLRVRALQEQGYTTGEILERLGLPRGVALTKSMEQLRVAYARLELAARDPRPEPRIPAPPRPSSAAPEPWTQARIVRAAEDWAREHGGPPAPDDWRHEPNVGRWPPLAVVIRRFGSWQLMLAAIDAPPARPAVASSSAPPREPGTRWTRQRILEAVREWERAYGRWPRRRDWRPAPVVPGSRPSQSTVVREFGSWRAMLDAVSETAPVREAGGQSASDAQPAADDEPTDTDAAGTAAGAAPESGTCATG